MCFAVVKNISLTFVQGDNGVDNFADGEGGLLLLRVLPLPDEPPVDEEDEHAEEFYAAAHADVSAD